MIKNIHTLTANERSKAWYYANKHNPRVVADRKARLLAWRKLNPERYLWQRARFRSMDDPSFTLLPEDIIIPEECPVLRVPFEFGTPYAMSLDKIDPKKSYTKDNVQVISRKANLMKQDASVNELRNFARWVSKTYTR